MDPQAKVSTKKGSPATALELDVAKALLDIEASPTCDYKGDLKDVTVYSAQEVEVKPGRKCIIVHIPARVWKSVQKVQGRLIQELEKKFAKSDFFYSKGALESKASVSDFFYRELGEPVEKSKPNYAKMQPQPNYMSVSELEKGLLPGQKPEPPPAPAKKRQPPQPTTKKEDGPLEPEELAKLEAAAIKAAQEHLLKTVAAAREADGKASYTPLGSRQPPLRETMKAAKGVRLVPDHVLVAELLGNPRPPTTAPSPNRKPVSFETKTKSAPELVAASLSGS